MSASSSAREPAVSTIEGDPVSQPLVPRVRRHRDRVLPILIVASLIVHALIFLPSLLPHASDKPREQEIPVELVREQPPPKPPEPKKPSEAKPPAKAPNPPPARSPAPKPPAPRPEAKKQPEPPKKPQPPKPPEQKKAAEQKPPPKPQDDVAERMKKLLGAQSLDPVAMPGESADGTDLVSYTQLVMSKLTKAEDHGKYPSRGNPGFATVTFLLGDAGEVLKVDLIRPSGDPVLDTEAVAVVHRAAPYPPPPPGGRREYTITMESRPIF